MESLTTNLLKLQPTDPLSRNIAFGTFLAASALWLAYTLNPKEKNLPPLVPYSLPIIGSTVEYRRDPEAFVRKAIAKYGPIFRVYMMGRIQTVVSSKDHLRRVTTSEEEFSFDRALREFFKMEVALGIPNIRLEVDRLHMIVAKFLTPNIKRYNSRLLKRLEYGMEIHFGKFEGTKIIDDPLETIGKIISLVSTDIFVGPEFCSNEEIVECFRTLSDDIAQQIQRQGLLLLFPTLAKLWQPIYFKFFAQSKHVNIIKRYVIPIAEKRRKDMAELGDNWKRPDDLLQSVIELQESDPSTPFSEEFLIGDLLALIFASVNTTTDTAAKVFRCLAANPQYIDVLRAEQDEVFSDPDLEGEFSYASIKKLVKLDSLIRETLRLNKETIALPHKNYTNEVLDIGDGVMIYPNDQVSLNFYTSRMSEEDHGPEPEAFNPWRYVGQHKNASKVGTDFLAFGMGKHTCPGRFFAVHLIKLSVSLTIKKYNLRALDVNDKQSEPPIVLTMI